MIINEFCIGSNGEFFQDIIVGFDVYPASRHSPETNILSVFVLINVSSDWYLFLNAVWVIFSSISLPSMCKMIFSYRERSMLVSLSFSESILAFWKLLTLTFWLKNLVSMLFRIPEPVMKVRSRFGKGFCFSCTGFRFS